MQGAFCFATSLNAHLAETLLRALRGDLVARLWRFLFRVELSFDATDWMQRKLAFGTPRDRGDSRNLALQSFIVADGVKVSEGRCGASYWAEASGHWPKGPCP